MKRKISIILSLLIIAFTLCSCEGGKGASESKKISIITTIFPAYDFARQVAGENADIKMLLTPGSEPHNYEPSAMDIVNIRNCDLFIYVGGESDAWTDEILESCGDVKTVKMFDSVNAVEEETIEGMQHSEEEEEHSVIDKEYDEHVWTSPLNALKISEDIEKSICEIDKANSEIYQDNFNSYKKKLTALDKEFQDFFSTCENKTIIFADRFPLRYFVDEYGLDYYAAFPGCSSETEASISTVAFLINKVREEKTKTVFYLENSNHTVADKISAETGVKTAVLHSCHNVSKEEFESGMTYIDLMELNLKTIREGL